MFLDQCSFEISVDEQRVTDACTHEKKAKDRGQHITDWYNKNCGTVTVLSHVLLRHRTTERKNKP